MKDVHEDIKAKQIELARHFADANPTEVTEVYWIHVKRTKGTYPRPKALRGKWLIFVNIKDLDRVWATIKQTTEEGTLGGSVKVATAKPNPLATDPNTKVICV